MGHSKRVRENAKVTKGEPTAATVAPHDELTGRQYTLATSTAVASNIDQHGAARPRAMLDSVPAFSAPPSHQQTLPDWNRARPLPVASAQWRLPALQEPRTYGARTHASPTAGLLSWLKQGYKQAGVIMG